MKIVLLVLACCLVIFAIGYLVWGKSDILYRQWSVKSSPKSQSSKSINKLATFAWWCFWCMQPSFDEMSWVTHTRVGFAWGDEQTATYEQVSAGWTNHREAIQIEYNPSVVSYAQLLENFRKQIDPTNPDGQFADKWFQYTTAIFVHDEEQKILAEQSKQILTDSKRYDKPLATQIISYSTFFPAQEYHQQYYRKSWLRYKTYKTLSGREAWVHSQQDLTLTWIQAKKEDQSVIKDTLTGAVDSSHWERPTSEQLQKTLTPLQFKVTQKNWTEPAFENELWDNHRRWIYVDIVSGEPLFSSRDKYDSGTGRPSFTRPINDEAITTHEDKSLWSTRVEIRSRYADSHLGHVFTDGPEERWWLRYCMNSAAMAFIPVEDMEKRWYSKRINMVE